MSTDDRFDFADVELIDREVARLGLSGPVLDLGPYRISLVVVEVENDEPAEPPCTPCTEEEWAAYDAHPHGPQVERIVRATVSGPGVEPEEDLGVLDALATVEALASDAGRQDVADEAHRLHRAVTLRVAGTLLDMLSPVGVVRLVDVLHRVDPDLAARVAQFDSVDDVVRLDVWTGEQRAEIERAVAQLQSGEREGGAS